jgi:hypothetical protein
MDTRARRTNASRHNRMGHRGNMYIEDSDVTSFRAGSWGEVNGGVGAGSAVFTKNLI